MKQFACFIEAKFTTWKGSSWPSFLGVVEADDLEGATVIALGISEKLYPKKRGFHNVEVRVSDEPMSVGEVVKTWADVDAGKWGVPAAGDMIIPSESEERCRHIR